MGARLIARENRLAAAIEGFAQTRARGFAMPAILLERQRAESRRKRFDTTVAANVLATMSVLTAGGNRSAASEAGAGGSGGGGYFDVIS